jgi:hypothetical protein
MKAFYWLPVIAAVALAGSALWAQAGDDMEKSLAGLKEAQAGKDAAQVKKLAVDTIALAKKAAAEPAPEDVEAKSGWQDRIDYAKNVTLQCEYALAATALQAPPETMIDLLTTLEQANPKSKYLDDAWGPYLLALNKTGASSKVPEVAAKALVNFPNNEDLLLVMAEHSLAAKQEDRALTYASRLVAAASRRPAGERKNAQALTRGYWIAGVVSGEKGKYVDADKNLRAALPGIGDNAAMKGAALFYLGVANFQLGKMTLNKARVLEGAKFSDQAAAIPGAYAQQAWKNAQIMKTEAGNMR